jgi:hypothetical protein
VRLRKGTLAKSQRETRAPRGVACYGQGGL